MPINEARFACLRGVPYLAQSRGGANISDWWRQVFSEHNRTLPNTKLDRTELKALCAENSGLKDTEVVATVMAWGGMRRNHGRLMKSRIDAIGELVGRLRTGRWSRSEAFSAFHGLRSAGELPGMTAAYFTKLIFFCPRQHDGYIMDQWTSKSVNLIFDEKIVDLSKAGFVTDTNNADKYERFCRCIEELGEAAGWEPEETELRIFSEGRGRGAWRNYVIENWRNAQPPV